MIFRRRFISTFSRFKPSSLSRGGLSIVIVSSCGQHTGQLNVLPCLHGRAGSSLISASGLSLLSPCPCIYLGRCCGDSSPICNLDRPHLNARCNSVCSISSPQYRTTAVNLCPYPNLSIDDVAPRYPPLPVSRLAPSRRDGNLPVPWHPPHMKHI